MIHLLYALKDLAQYVEHQAEQRSIASGAVSQIRQSVLSPLPLRNWVQRSVQRFTR